MGLPVVRSTALPLLCALGSRQGAIHALRLSRVSTFIRFGIGTAGTVCIASDAQLSAQDAVWGRKEPQQRFTGFAGSDGHDQGTISIPSCALYPTCL